MTTASVLATAARNASPTATLVVALVTVAAFIGAWVAVRRARVPAPTAALPGRFGAPIIDTDLLELEHSTDSVPFIVKAFEYSLIGALAGYAFLDRGFAWFHLPGTPLFIGEMVIALGVAAMLSQPSPILTAIRRSAPLKWLLVYMGWGLVLLGLIGSGYGIDAVRDSVLWYYGAVSILVTFLIIADPSRPRRWIRWFATAIPWLVGWLFIAIILDSVLGSGALLVPDSQVSLFSHSAGNSGVIAVICLSVIWLVDRDGRLFTPMYRLGLTSAIGALVLFVALKNRGGFVAGSIGIIMILAFMYQKRTELLVILVGVATVLATVALVSQFSVALFGSRELSAEQFITNIRSIVDPDSGGHRQVSTTEWRLELWTAVLNDVNSDFPLTGYGPGPDIGKIYNVTTNEDVPLRNPHNSHVGVIARMGWVGFALWIIMWSVWGLLLMDLRSRLARASRHSEAGLVAVPLIASVMILVNAFFDPSIEGPQVGFWLWFMFGAGAALHLVYHGFGDAGARDERRSTAPASDVAVQT